MTPSDYLKLFFHHPTQWVAEVKQRFVLGYNALPLLITLTEMAYTINRSKNEPLVSLLNSYKDLAIINQTIDIKTQGVERSEREREKVKSRDKEKEKERIE